MCSWSIIGIKDRAVSYGPPFLLIRHRRCDTVNAIKQMFRHKVLFGCFLFSLALVGISAGLRVAQIESEYASKTSEGATYEYDDDGVEIDGSFFSDLFGKNEKKTGTSAQTNETPTVKPKLADQVKAQAYVVGDIDTGEILLSKNGLTVYPFASMSKLITALVANDIYSGTTTITISEDNTKVPIDSSLIQAGETFTVNELLHAMLMNSSNIAAEALGSTTDDRMAFLDLMSGYSWEIGMNDSYFADPTGLSERNAGTAKGFFAMAQYLYKNRPEILAITRMPKMSLATTTDHGSHEIMSTHPYVNDPRFLGGKTGRTEAAQETMLTIMKLGSRNIAFIILRSPYTRAADTELLIGRISAILAAD